MNILADGHVHRLLLQEPEMISQEQLARLQTVATLNLHEHFHEMIYLLTAIKGELTKILNKLPGPPPRP